MTYPGLILLVGVGIGLATFLYYMFAENESENEQRQQYSYADDRGSDHYNDDWRISPASSYRSENGRLNRRNLSKSSAREGGKGRSHSSKEDINNCSICQYALIESDVIQLQCRHNFHKDCIKKLRSYTPKAVCPNCRRSIAHTT